jgi:hypothetical protein
LRPRREWKCENRKRRPEPDRRLPLACPPHAAIIGGRRQYGQRRHASLSARHDGPAN